MGSKDAFCFCFFGGGVLERKRKLWGAWNNAGVVLWASKVVVLICGQCVCV